MVALTVCRAGALLEVSLQLEMEAGLGTTRLLHFAGAQFQVPPPPPPPHTPAAFRPTKHALDMLSPRKGVCLHHESLQLLPLCM